MATDKFNMKEWIAQEQGKHFCHCGCNQEIIIKAHQHTKGIPQYRKGHLGRVNKGGTPVRQTWVEENQGKYICECGCGEPIELKPFHKTGDVPKFIPGHLWIYTKAIRLEREEKREIFKVKRTNKFLLRFWNQVDKGSPSECWEWLGKKTLAGYGSFTFNGISRPAHRVSFFIFNGKYPDNQGCHSCDNPPCVNPFHIFDGTQADNMKDASLKEELAQKYTKEQVLEFVALVKEGFPRKYASEKTGITKEMGEAILHGLAWKHFTGIPNRYEEK